MERAALLASLAALAADARVDHPAGLAAATDGLLARLGRGRCGVDPANLLGAAVRPPRTLVTSHILLASSS